MLAKLRPFPQFWPINSDLQIDF